MEVADPIENIELLIISDREHCRMLEVLSGRWLCTYQLTFIAVQVARARSGSVKWVQVKCTPVLAFLQYLPPQYMFALLCFAFDICTAMQV